MIDLLTREQVWKSLRNEALVCFASHHNSHWRKRGGKGIERNEGTGQDKEQKVQDNGPQFAILQYRAQNIVHREVQLQAEGEADAELGLVQTKNWAAQRKN